MNIAAKFNSSLQEKKPSFFDRVSDAVFGRRAWGYLSEKDSRALRLIELPILRQSSESASPIEALRYDLPFYGSRSLVEVRSEQGKGQTWCLAGDCSPAPLDGASAPIHDANDACSLALNKDTVIDYVRFFCFFVHGDDGPFFVVQDLNHPVFDLERINPEERATIEKELRPPELLDVSEDGVFKVSAVVMYGNALFKTEFMVQPSGNIEMLDDTPVAGDIPALKLKPNY